MKDLLIITKNDIWGCVFGEYIQRYHNLLYFHFPILKGRRQKFSSKKKRLMQELYAFIKIILNVTKIDNRKTFCTGCQLGVLAAYKILSPFLKDYSLFIYNFYLHGLSNKKVVKLVLRFLLDNKHLTLICQSPNEVKFYKELSNRAYITFVPYCSDIMPHSYELKQKELCNYFFSGGFTNRDYNLIGKLAERYPNQQFVIVASALNKKINDMPRNVYVYKDLTNEEFNNLLSHSEAVIVALYEDVGSSGQILSISAMRKKKPIIYTDISAINYYFPQGCGYPYKIGDIDSLEAAYKKIVNNWEEAVKVGERAYKQSLQYKSSNCYEQIYKLIFTSNEC